MEKLSTCLLAFFFFTSLLFSQLEKVVLIEEGTGTWCQWCPCGDVYAQQLVLQYDDVLFVTVHNGDPMENADYDAASAFTGFPGGPVDIVFY